MYVRAEDWILLIVMHHGAICPHVHYYVVARAGAYMHACMAMVHACKHMYGPRYSFTTISIEVEVNYHRDSTVQLK